MDTVYHIPAMLKETLEVLSIQKNGLYVDLTFGGGGHSRAIMEHLGPDGRLYSMDQDQEAQQNAIDDRRWHFIHGNFRYLDNYLDYHNLSEVDGFLADLGVSFHHFDTAERGFSFRFDGPLDMRMNRQGGKTAAQIVNEYEEQDLARVLYLYGELKNSRALAHKICLARTQKPIETTGELLHVLGYEDIEGHKKVLAPVFQALRIEVNDELGALRNMLETARDYLKPGGRLVVLTYHSLEDRIVKNFLRSGNLDGEIEKDFYGNNLSPFKLIAKGDTASEEEIAQNPRARSAKLRAAEKL